MGKLLNIADMLISILYRFIKMRDETKAMEIRQRIINDAGTEWVQQLGGKDRRNKSKSSSTDDTKHDNN